MDDGVAIESISAITLATHDMARSVAFYGALGFDLTYGGPEASFTVFKAGPNYLNVVLAAADASWNWWGRFVVYVSDVDAHYQRALEAGLSPEFAPRDAPWNERYFHLIDPDGHEVSFARRLAAPEA